MVVTARAVSSARGAAMAATHAAGLKGRGRSTSSMWGRKAKLSQHAQELRTIITSQEQERKAIPQSCEEELHQKRELLPRLREAVRDVRAPSGVQKVAQEKLQAEIYARVNTCNMLLYQVRQRSRARDELQRQLQRLQAVEKQDKQHQAQLQAVRQLENSIEKMLMKVHAGQKVTSVYLAVRDVLRKELAHLPLHLDLLCGTAELYDGEMEDVELMAADALRAAAATKEDLEKVETQLRVDREFRYRSQAAQEGHVEEGRERHLREQAGHELDVDFSNLDLQDPLAGTQLEATKSQIEHEAWVATKMEKAKAAVLCSHLWDMAGRFLAQQKSSADLDQYLQQCKEKQQALKETLRKLELEHAELKFRQPPNTFRKLEEELRRKLQQEEARREQMRAQMLRDQDLLLQFENATDNLVVLLRGITVPGQDSSAKAQGVQEKLQHCRQRLRYLVQRVASLPPNSHSLDEDDEAFVKVRNLLEKTMAEDPQSLKISLEDTENPPAFEDEDHDLVLTREDIKKQGLLLIETNKKHGKK